MRWNSANIFRRHKKLVEAEVVTRDEMLDDTTRDECQIIIFGDFPNEIRHEIWKRALPGPRVVRYGSHYWRTGAEDGVKARREANAMNTSVKHLANLIRACKEVRQLISSDYFLVLSPWEDVY